jgi:DNA-binding NarL/FixJ family response regulator
LCSRKIVPLLDLAVEKGVNADLASKAMAGFGVEVGLGPISLAQTGETLTPREVETLQLLVQGASNQEIADKLVITLRTAKAHVSNILSKLQVSTRSEAIVRCHEWNLLSTTNLH